MAQVRVVSAIADKHNLVLYLEDGTTVTVPQGDPRISKLVEDLVPFHARGETAIVDLDNYSIYNTFSEQTGGFVRFFKIAKDKVKSFFGLGSSEHEPKVQKPSPVIIAETVVVAAVAPTVDKVLEDAIAMGHDDAVKETETVLAVVKTENGEKIIPNAEALKDQIVHATSTGKTIGITNLMKRMANMVDKRSHSVEDLLRFLERGDLPVADDGSIIAYKLLNKKDGPYYADCHSGNVKQRVGSLVIVDESMVDKNRRNECSNGLHIARRGYLGGFGGNVCVLCKINPEDVITVPHGDANKVRVCAYQILAELPADVLATLKSNKAMTGNAKASEMLALAIAGKYPEPIEEVRITESYGGGLKITPMKNGKKVPIAEVTKEDLAKAKAFDDAKAPSKTVDVKELNKKITAEEAKVAEPVKKVETVLNPPTTEGLETIQKALEQAPAKPISNKDRAKSLYELMVSNVSTNAEKIQHANALMDLKKKSKVSWEKLGFHFDILQSISFAQALPVEVKPEPQTQAEPAQQAVKPKDEVKAPEPAPTPASDAPAREWARYYYNQLDWTLLFGLKKAKKVNWERLGFTVEEATEIEKHK